MFALKTPNGDEPASAELPESATDRDHPRLGPSIHVYEAGVSSATRQRKPVVLAGLFAALIVPIGLTLVKGLAGAILALAGGLVAVTCYLVSGRRPLLRRGVRVQLFQKGISCCHGSASRELLWNEVIDITARRITLPGGKEATTVVLDVVGEAPLLIMVGARQSDAQNGALLVDALSTVWLRVWCRRAIAMLASDRTLEVGRTSLSPTGLLLENRRLDWKDIEGLESVNGTDCVRTRQGAEVVERNGALTPFPSAAKRIAACASCISQVKGFLSRPPAHCDDQPEEPAQALR